MVATPAIPLLAVFFILGPSTVWNSSGVFKDGQGVSGIGTPKYGHSSFHYGTKVSSYFSKIQPILNAQGDSCSPSVPDR